MKKYTNKILIITGILFLVVTTTLFFIKTYELKQRIKHSNSNELITNH